MDLNREDNGNRKFILCTNNENNISTEVCYPRLKKLINGFKDKKIEEFSNGYEENLRYFRTSFVSSENTDKNKENIMKECVEMICLKEDTFINIYEDKFIKLFENQHSITAILFDDLKIDELKKYFNVNKQVNIYIFSLSEDDLPMSFKILKIM